MQFISEEQFLHNIENRKIFSASIEGGAFTLKIERYEPVLCAAIHNGDRFPAELVQNCLLSEAERFQEEDPYTGSFIEEQAITIIANDSRYAYDLNRKPAECVYKTAWGKDVWKNPLSNETIMQNQKKHAQFYRVINAVIEVLRKDFGQCVIYDIHSYNYKRYSRTDLPVFNLGTTSVTNENWRPVIAAWLKELKNITIESVVTTVAENDIFLGKGFLATSCHERYENVLVLATEVKKVFMDELTGEPDPVVLPEMQKAFNAAIRESITRSTELVTL